MGYVLRYTDIDGLNIPSLDVIYKSMLILYRTLKRFISAVATQIFPAISLGLGA